MILAVSERGRTTEKDCSNCTCRQNRQGDRAATAPIVVRSLCAVGFARSELWLLGQRDGSGMVHRRNVPELLLLFDVPRASGSGLVDHRAVRCVWRRPHVQHVEASKSSRGPSLLRLVCSLHRRFDYWADAGANFGRI